MLRVLPRPSFPFSSRSRPLTGALSCTLCVEHPRCVPLRSRHYVVLFAQARTHLRQGGERVVVVGGQSGTMELGVDVERARHAIKMWTGLRKYKSEYTRSLSM